MGIYTGMKKVVRKGTFLNQGDRKEPCYVWILLLIRVAEKIQVSAEKFLFSAGYICPAENFLFPAGYICPTLIFTVLPKNSKK